MSGGGWRVFEYVALDVEGCPVRSEEGQYLCCVRISRWNQTEERKEGKEKKKKVHQPQLDTKRRR
jgi:hypothetical protein